MVLAERAERANGVGTTAAAARFGVVFSQWRWSSSSEFGKQWQCNVASAVGFQAFYSLGDAPVASVGGALHLMGGAPAAAAVG
mmetsp:Transcript_30175/g.52242  ORF Transcript_30175/g.52242 Transcript_30175/m.52242 type:complete len:83 (+) Transcript_30175:76-324(+)